MASFQAEVPRRVMYSTPWWIGKQNLIKTGGMMVTVKRLCIVAIMLFMSLSQGVSVAESLKVGLSQLGQFENDNSQAVVRGPFSMADLQFIMNSFVTKTAGYWSIYRSEVRNSKDPYETSDERTARVQKGLEESSEYLRKLFTTSSSWQFRFTITPESVTYDPDKEVAFIVLPEIPIPSTSSKQQVAFGVTLPGHSFPNVYAEFEPLWTHDYMHYIASPLHRLKGSFSAPVGRGSARDLDIVKNHGVLLITVMFGSKSLSSGVADCKGPIEFPVVKLIDAAWRLGTTVLWSCGAGHGRDPAEFVVPGPARAVGTSPNVRIPYNFADLEDQREMPEIHRKMMDRYDFDLDGVNSDGVPLVERTAAVYLHGKPEGAMVTVDGVAEGVAPIVVSSLAPGYHNITVRARFYQPERLGVVCSAHDTIRTRYNLAQFRGSWTTYNPDPGLRWMEGKHISFKRPVGSNELHVFYNGRNYKVQVGRNEDFWKLHDADEFAFQCGNRKIIVHKNDCVGFGFSTETSPKSSYYRYFFFMMEDGRGMVGQVFYEDRTILGSRVFPGLRPKELFCCEPK